MGSLQCFLVIILFQAYRTLFFHEVALDLKVHKSLIVFDKLSAEIVGLIYCLFTSIGFEIFDKLNNKSGVGMFSHVLGVLEWGDVLCLSKGTYK